MKNLDIKRKSLLVIILFLISCLVSLICSLEIKTIIELLLILLFTYLFKKEIKQSLKKFKIKYLLYIGLFYLFATLLNIYTNKLLLNSLNIDISNNLALDSILNQSKFYFILYTFITGPILECFVLPISFYELLKDNKKLYYILSTIIYGLFLIIFSFTSVNQLFLVISYSFYGFSLAYLYDKTKNIFVPYIFKLIQALAILFVYLY